MDRDRDRALARAVAQQVAAAGGQVYYVGGIVRDTLLGLDCKDVDIEVYGIPPQALRQILQRMGTVLEMGSSFGILGLRGSNIDISMPRRERRTGAGHRDFDVEVDPFLTTRQASERRDFTVNAMMMEVLSGRLVDHWGGEEDLRRGILRCVSPKTFPEDALRVFRAAQFSARFEMRIEADTLSLARRIDVRQLSRERVFEELSKALLKAQKPSVFFRALRQMDHLKEFFPEVEACIGVAQNPRFHPEGDVFEHTMLVLDAAAQLREQAVEPLYFMLSALLHDLGKCVSTRVDESGKITAYGHELEGVPLVVRQLERLTNAQKLIRYVTNQTELHMRPNILAASRSAKKKTRRLFDESVCPEDLILLSKADACGKTDRPYDPEAERFLRERLEDYRRVLQRPMVTGSDLVAAGYVPDERFRAMLARARQLHFSGLDRESVLTQLEREFKK